MLVFGVYGIVHTVLLKLWNADVACCSESGPSDLYHTHPLESRFLVWNSHHQLDLFFDLKNYLNQKVMVQFVGGAG